MFSSRNSRWEMLESRVLLSAGVQTDLIVLPQESASSDVQGYTPAQIRHAYGFDQVADDGAGQTIAIVNAFDDPNIGSDLRVFDKQFGIAAPPSLRVVDQTGGDDLPFEDSGW